MKWVMISSVFVVVTLVQVMVNPSQASLTCEQVEASLSPCFPYLTKVNIGEPSLECCNGVRTIKGMVQQASDKRTACTCIKNAAKHYVNLKDEAAQALPEKCGVKMDVPVSPRTNCLLIN